MAALLPRIYLYITALMLFILSLTWKETDSKPMSGMTRVLTEWRECEWYIAFLIPPAKPFLFNFTVKYQSLSYFWAKMLFTKDFIVRGIIVGQKSVACLSVTWEISSVTKHHTNRTGISRKITTYHELPRKNKKVLQMSNTLSLSPATL